MSHTYSEFNDNVTKTDEICGNKTIDRKTRQVLFFECSMDFIQQTFLRKSEKFNEQRATQLLEKYKQRHRKIKCSAYFLIDRIRFKRKRPIGIRPFRKEVIYREIKHFFVFPNYPEVFMICIVDENKNRRSYESFQCANSDTVSTVCCLTYKASIDVNNILRDTLSIEQISVSPLSSTTDHSSANELEYSTLNTLLNATNDSGNTDSDFVEPPKALGSDYIIDGEQNDSNFVGSNSNVYFAYAAASSNDDDDEDDQIKISRLMPADINSDWGRKTLKLNKMKHIVNTSTESFNRSSFHNPKRFSLKDDSSNALCSTETDYTSRWMNTIANNEVYYSCVPKTDCTSRRNNIPTLVLPDNEVALRKEKSYTIISSSSTSSGCYDFEEKQDSSLLYRDQNSSASKFRRPSVFLDLDLNQSSGNNIADRKKKTRTIAKTSNTFCHNSDINMYEDDLNFESSDCITRKKHGTDQVNHLENMLRKSLSHMDIRSADITYLCYDPAVGVRVNNRGPLYMFMARYDNDRAMSSYDCSHSRSCRRK